MSDPITDFFDGRLKTENPMDRSRPYDGQAHTSFGARGQTLVVGLTMRDISDCFVRGFLLATGKGAIVEANACDYRDVYDIECDFDPIAVVQSASCEIEKMMGIYPNIDPLCFSTPAVKAQEQGDKK